MTQLIIGHPTMKMMSFILIVVGLLSPTQLITSYEDDAPQDEDEDFNHQYQLIQYSSSILNFSCTITTLIGQI